MGQTVISNPEGFAQLLRLSEKEFGAELVFMAAAKLYELGRLSSGQAARLAQMDRVGFLARLSQIEVAAINLRDEEIDAEIEAARELAG
jgi:predicted HTH domain antitoxin